jgi:predicted metal-dependent phosphoesterase TrpH
VRPRYDLHCHSTRSDGLLSPAEVVRRAASRGVDVLALTDHDDMSGLAEAKQAAGEAGIDLVAGTELSVSWEDLTVHVVGLNVDPDDAPLAEGIASIRSGRSGRARRIGDSLAAAGIPGAYDGAMKYVTSEALVSRTHFARYLVEAGYVRDVKDVFRRYLVPGKPGYVEHAWATLPQAIGWIHGAGGVAVLAHPGRYKVDGTAGMRKLLGEFKDAGGDAHRGADAVAHRGASRGFRDEGARARLRRVHRLRLPRAGRERARPRRPAAAARRRRAGVVALVR